LLDIVDGIHASEIDHDELRNEEEVKKIGAFLQTLLDWGDLLGMGEIETYQRVEISYNLTKDLNDLEKLGFIVFGDRRRSKMTNDQKDDLGSWNIGTIVILREDNPSIINQEEIVSNPKQENNNCQPPTSL